MLIASDKADPRKAQNPQTFSQHLLLLLHLENQQLERSRRICFLFPYGLFVQLTRWWQGILREVKAIGQDRKSTRLNSSHLVISYAVFCLKKKNKKKHLVRAQNHVEM